MIKVTFELNNEDDRAAVIAMLGATNALPIEKKASTKKANVKVEPEPVEEPVVDDDMLGGGSELDDLLGGADDDLSSLMEPEPEVKAITVEDMKAAISGAIKAKGKEETNKFLQSVMGKLGITQLSAIPEDKKESFVNIMGAFAAKK